MNFRHGLTRINAVINGLLQALGWLMLCGTVFWAGWLFGRCYEQKNVQHRTSNFQLPTIEEQTQFLESLGHDCGEPKDIAGPKFCRALNQWQIEQYAARSFTAEDAKNAARNMKNIKNQTAKSKNAEAGR